MTVILLTGHQAPPPGDGDGGDLLLRGSTSRSPGEGGVHAAALPAAGWHFP